MATVYITGADAFIGKTDERLNVQANKKTLLDVPLIKIDGVVILGRATVSPAALSELLERHIPLTFLTGTGRYLGRLEPEVTKEGLRTFLRLYEQKKQSKFKHPVMSRQCTYQEAFEIQARLLAKYLMGETDKYPPLVLK